MERQNIASLAKQPNTEVCGIFRACSPTNRIARNQSPYKVMRLVDVSGQMIGFAWPNTFSGNYCPNDNEIIRVIGKTKKCPTNGSIIIDIKDAEPVPRIEVNPVALLPPQTVANLEDLQQLIQFIDTLTSASLKKFLYLVFSEDSLTFPFISGPSSKNWHHTEQGGNLRHSLECASIVSRIKEIPQYERELGIVGALLHDIGKIQMGYNRQGYAPPAVHHDALTLEILAGPLRMLDQEWPDGASMLRQIWTYPFTKNKNMKKNNHVPTVVHFVWSVDALSAAIYKEKAAYASAPDWKRYARLQNETYWRPSADNYLKKAA